MSAALPTHPDSDWAGDNTNRKSTSGGIAFMGAHCLKSWSTNQTIVALSSGEAELYAINKVAGNALGIKSLLKDMGSLLR